MGFRFAALALLMTACGSPLDKFPPLREIADLSDLVVRADALPAEDGFVDVDGVQLHFRHTTKGSDNPTIVLIHGLLSDSSTWRFIAGALGEDSNLLSVDLMGCGRSDKPDPDDMPADAYGPEKLARQVLEVMRQRTTGRLVVVGHSLGGTIILRMLGSPALRAEYGDVVGRVDKAVLMSAVDFAIERVHPVFEKIVDLSDFVAGVADFLGLVEKLTAQAIRDGTSDPSRMPREETERMVRALSARDTRHAAQAMIQQAVPFTEDRRPVWDRIETLTADYGKIEQPCLIIWGARDETFGSAMGFKLAGQIKHAWLHIIERRMHQLPGEAPHACARLIREFVKNGGAGRLPVQRSRAGP